MPENSEAGRPAESAPGGPRARRSTSSTRAKARPRTDSVLADAVDLARRAAEDVARPGSVGDHVGTRMEEDRVLTHLFTALDPGYVGWLWSVTVARVPRSKVVTVDEVDLVPGDGALLAPPWVPWDQRLRPSDVSRSDVLPYRSDDDRLEEGFEDTGEDADDDPDLPFIRDLGLGRPRVLSRQGRDQAVERWYGSERGPAGARLPRATCSTCGFLVKMPGSWRTVFGVCANEWSPDDGTVVSLDHTCGAHSEVDIPTDGPEWPVRPSHVNDLILDAEAVEQK